MRLARGLAISCLALCLAQCSSPQSGDETSQASTLTETCDVEFIILGAGQDAGAPQIGNPDDPAWDNSALALTPTSAALVDHRAETRYLFEATPQITAQLNLLDDLAPSDNGPLGLSGVFLTHAHIGHYAGLMFFGREAAGTRDLDVYVMPRMANYLESNGPWSQLVTLENISLNVLENKTAVTLSPNITVTPLQVPHRDEFSETVGYVISGPTKSALFLPDIDDWDRWESEYGQSLEDIIAQVDYAFVDATFFDDTELPGRDMSLIPHPRVVDTMYRVINNKAVKDGPQRVIFIHYNHTNPIRDPDSPLRLAVLNAGFNIANAGDIFCLSD